MQHVKIGRLHKDKRTKEHKNAGNEHNLVHT